MQIVDFESVGDLLRRSKIVSYAQVSSGRNGLPTITVPTTLANSGGAGVEVVFIFDRAGKLSGIEVDS